MAYCVPNIHDIFNLCSRRKRREHKCVVYHDSVKQPAGEVMIRSGDKWISVDWVSSPLAHQLRNIIYDAVAAIEGIPGLEERVREISRDVTRIRRDFDRMLACIKLHSRAVVITRKYLEDNDIHGEVKTLGDHVREANAWWRIVAQ